MLNNEDLIFVRTRLSFWDKLSNTDKNIVEDNIIKVSYNKGFNLHSTDNECLGVLLIHSGELRAYILSEDGREITLFRLSSGDTCVLSASCILNSIQFDVHIDAENDTNAFLLNIGAFSRVSNKNIYVENFLYENTVKRFSDIMLTIVPILFISFDKRLAIFLLDEMAKTNSSELNLTQEQIAKYIGSAREVVSRRLKFFQSQGILGQSRGSIHIMNSEKLKEIILQKGKIKLEL